MYNSHYHISRGYSLIGRHGREPRAAWLGESFADCMTPGIEDVRQGSAGTKPFNQVLAWRLSVVGAAPIC
jgi:hypothetical protein